MRVDIKAILRDPVKRRELMVRTIIATQAREGIVTSQEQAEAAYDAVLMKVAGEHCRCEHAQLCASCSAKKEVKQITNGI